MKKIYTTLVAVLAISHFSYGQNTFPGSGNVGIGISNPAYPLTLNSSTETGILTTSNGTNIFLSHGGWGLGAGKLGIGNGTTPTLTVNSIINGGTSVGNVGIGTANPQSLLHLWGGGLTIGSGSIINNSDGALSIGNVSQNYNPTMGNWINTGSTLIMNGGGSTTMAFHHSGLRVDFIKAGSGVIQMGYNGGWGEASIGFPGGGVWNSNGNVGIGYTADPTSGNKLFVNGKGYFSGQVNLPNGVDVAYGTVGTGAFIGQYYGAGKLKWYNGTGGADKLTIDQSNNKATFTANVIVGGNVGIGTQSPDEMLTVNGKIHAKEVRIDSSIPTPDYVFNKDYPLMSLTEVKNYIDKNHHLPEVPSAAEVGKNGLKLAEMNLILLKKVEELTLHLIEKEKKEKLQEVINKGLQKKLKSQTQKINKLFKLIDNRTH